MFFIILFGIQQLIIIMEEDILNYSPIVMFRGTPCTMYMHKDNNARDVMYSNSNLCPQCWTIY